MEKVYKSTSSHLFAYASLMMLLFCHLTYGLSQTDISEFQKQISQNVTDGLGELTEDVLQMKEVVDVFSSSYSRSEALANSDIESIMSSLVGGVQEEFVKGKMALLNVQRKLQDFLTQPRPASHGPPRLIKNCCKTPVILMYNAKLGLAVNQSECCARNAETDSLGCNLRADEVFFAMKTNFDTLPSILWQEIGTKDGQHVQYPSASRSCDTGGHSNSLLLRKSYVTRATQPKLHLVIVLDASDEMLNKVHNSPMNASHWDVVKRAVFDTLGSLPARDMISLVITGKETTTIKGCNMSLFQNTRENFEKLQKHLVTTSPRGDPDYTEAFRQALLLLNSQERLDKALNVKEDYVNVILFLTNAETPVLEEDEFLKEISDGQKLLTYPSRIMVYALEMHGKQSAFKTFLKLADQNNLKLKAFNGTDNETAGSWFDHGISTAQGPPGIFKSVLDTKLFKFSEEVLQFSSYLSLNPAQQTSFVLDPVNLNSKEGLTLHTMVHLSNTTDTLALIAANLSVDMLLGGVQAFRHQTKSYTYVVEKGSGHVVSHPRVRISSESISRDVVMATLEEVETDLTTDQRLEILSSGTSIGQFKARLRPGRERTSSAVESTSVFHRLVLETNFIIVLVIFDSEMTTFPTSPQQVTRSTSAVYHRFDKIAPPSAGTCILSSMWTERNKIGIKFSTEMFVNRRSYLYEGLTQQQMEDLDNFIKSPSSVPTILYNDSSYLTELVAMTSQHLLEVWNNTKVTATHRYIATPSGILATSPATALTNRIDVQNYQWYSEALSLQNTTVVSRETFPGSAFNFIISQAIVLTGKTVGVAAASVPGHVLEFLIRNKVKKCFGPMYTCKLVDLHGYLMSLPEAPGSTSHLVEALPFVANRLLQLGAMKPVWCKDLAHRQNRLGYIINVTASGVSSDPNISDNCKTFYLQPIAQSNLLVLIIPSGCMQNLTETCIPRAPVLPPLVPSSAGLRQCLRCVNGTSTMPTCQLLCQCPMASNLCPDPQRTLKDSSAICTGSQDLPSPYDIKPNPPSPAVSICPKTCSEVYTKIDCGNITDCVWDTSKTFPTCIHNVRLTTVATTSTVSTTNTPLTTTSITTLTTTTLATSTSTASTTSSSTTTASTTPTTTTTLASSTSAASTTNIPSMSTSITTPTTTTLATPTTTSVETTSTAPSHSLSAKIATNSTTAPITGSTETMVTAIPAAITTIGSSTLYLSKLFTTAPPSVPTTSSFTEFPTFVTAQPTIDSKPTGDVTESQTMSSPAMSYLNASNFQTSIPEQYMTENNYKSSGKTDSSLRNIIIAASVAAVVCLMAAVAAVVYMKMVKRPNHVHDKSHNNGGRERSNYIIDDNDINHDYTYITPDRPRYVTVFNVAPHA